MPELNDNEKMLQFVSWCIEMYAAEKQIDAQQLASEWYHQHVFTYLLDCYDVLHTQGKDYILGQIENFLINKPTTL